MTERNQVRDAERLSEDAAREAGITLGAFEQALAEFRGAGVSSLTAAPGRRWRLTRLWPVVAVGLLSFLVLSLLVSVA
ncbi:MAG TPA: hypothetical protein VM076_17775 [Gemmatimonadaceae bacterium]|nr:hypothetical protein [Gemmatimonadaceae bacterium]